MEGRFVESEEAMIALGVELSLLWKAGDIVVFSGDLGAGKTTLVRGILKGLGWDGVVRSPTFNLIQIYETTLPVLHADLYRVAHAAGIGLEEYFDDHLCLIEWPDRLVDMVDLADCWQIQIQFVVDGREVTLLSVSSVDN